MNGFQLKQSGMLVVLSAPSGGGKSTILNRLLAEDESLAYSISATTRPPRTDEKHGREYYFYSLDEFQNLIQQNAFYEYFEVHDNFYGTLKREVDSKIAAGKDVLLDIDVQGGMKLKKVIPESLTIFLLPPSMELLEERLRGRASDSAAVIDRRLQNARGEIRLASRYDYVVINHDLEQTVRNVRTIIEAQHFRTERLELCDEQGNALER